MRSAQAKDVIASLNEQIHATEKQSDAMLERIMQATNATVIRAYEGKIAELDKTKRLLQENLANRATPKGSFDDVLEHAMQFLSNPWKIWETGQSALRQTVLKLAFTERLHYHRNTGTRTPKTALVFKALGGGLGNEVKSGAPERIRTSDPLIRSQVLYPAELRVH
jgi:site-specific DNA recombinase